MKTKLFYLFLLFIIHSFAFADVDYLVVYHSNFADQNGWQLSLEKLLEGHGHELAFCPVSNGNIASGIRTMISTLKNYAYPNLKYVLLVGKGKDNLIPQGEIYPAYNHTVSSSYGNFIPFYYYIDNNYWADQKRDIPSDWQYVDGLNLLIGRIPASSISDVENWVSKLEDYYQSLLIYDSSKNKIRHFCQNNDNINNHCQRYQAELKINKSFQNHLDETEYDFEVHYMRDVHISNYCDHSEEADELFRDKIEDGAGVVMVSGTGSDQDNFAGFFFTPDISNYAFSNANPNFIIGNTCTIGNTSHPGSTYGTVLENLLINPNDGIVGGFAPTVIISTISSYVGDDIISSIISETDIRCIGEIALSFKSIWDTIGTVNYLPGKGNVKRPFNGSYTDYHAKSMVLYGDPSMPLALYQHKKTNITSNTVWQGSIIVDNDITISSGVTLTIMPGTGIFIAQNAKVTVEGHISALGTSAYPIKFSSTGGLWNRIELRDSSQFSYCLFENGAWMYIKNQPSTFSHCVFKKPAIKTESNGTFNMTNCIVENGFCGMGIYTGTVGISYLTNCTIRNNTSWGIKTSYDGRVVLDETEVYDNGDGVVVGYHGILDLTPKRNAILNNNYNEIEINDQITAIYPNNAYWYGDIYDNENPNPGYYIDNFYQTSQGENVYNHYISVKAEGVYWGTTNTTYIQQRFSAPGYIDYTPYFSTSQTAEYNIGAPESGLPLAKRVSSAPVVSLSPLNLDDSAPKVASSVLSAG
ncbi:MAG: C25 family cysteine peptidase, partial [Candidatus Neomarinimicrobiota bacterium]